MLLLGGADCLDDFLDAGPGVTDHAKNLETQRMRYRLQRPGSYRICSFFVDEVNDCVSQDLVVVSNFRIAIKYHLSPEASGLGLESMARRIPDFTNHQ